MIQLPDEVKASLLSNGQSLAEASSLRPLLLVFLRHFGCTFCREALSDLMGFRLAIECQGISLVLVHMSPKDEAETFFARYGLEDCLQISDPKCRLYEAFGLKRISSLHLLNLKTWARAFYAGIVQGNGIGAIQGDPFQMPGVFLIYKSRLLGGNAPKRVDQVPDYLAIANLGQD